jgi:shikimate dehydrogenase
MPADVTLVGLIGHPVGHSRSPALQQAAFDALGIPARYVLWETPAAGLPARVAALRGPGMLGANVTIPHKSAVLPLLDALAPDAERLGAVNTIVRETTASGGVRLVGHNTDVPGLRIALAELGANLAAGRMLVLGAGGAARAAVALSASTGAEPQVAARNPAAARALLADPARALDLADAPALAAALRKTTVLVNATPVGMNAPDASPLSAEQLAQLPSGAIVFDMVYAPAETALVRSARALGHVASGGLPMLLHQGAAALRLWTGREPPLDAMRAALGLAATPGR